MENTMTSLLAALKVNNVKEITNEMFNTLSPEQQALVISNGYVVKVAGKFKVAAKKHLPTVAFFVSGVVTVKEHTTNKDGKQGDNFIITLNCEGTDNDNLKAMFDTQRAYPRSIPRAMGKVLQLYVDKNNDKFTPVEKGDKIMVTAEITEADTTTFTGKDGLDYHHNKSGVQISYMIEEKAVVAKSARQIAEEKMIEREVAAEYNKRQMANLVNDNATLDNITKLKSLGFDVNPLDFM